MFANMLSGRHSDSHPSRPNRRLVGKVDAALAALPAPWQVLRNRRASAADGPPWAKYIALHPKKGIALIDIVPANPHAAVAPLDDFLQRTGFAAFSRGDPPIVAVALAERDLRDLANCLSHGFAGGPRCGIKNASWTDAAIELLATTPGLLLTRLGRSSEPKADAREPAREDDDFEPAPPRAAVEPEPAQTRKSRDDWTIEDPVPPLAATGKNRDDWTVEDPVPPLAATGKNRDDWTVEDPVLPLAAEPPPVQASARREEAPAQAPRALQDRAEPGSAREPRLGAFEEPDWRSARLTSFEHRGSNRRRALWLAAVPAAAAAIALVAYPQLANRLSALAPAPQAVAPQPTDAPNLAAAEPASTDTRSRSDRVTEALPPSALPTTGPATAPPPVAAATAPPASKAEAPTVNPQPQAPKSEAFAKAEIGTPPGAKNSAPETTAAPRSQPRAPSETARKAASRPQPAVPADDATVASRTPSTSETAPQHRVKVANAKSDATPPVDDGTGSSESILTAPSRDAAGRDAAASVNGAPSSDETVTIDGVTYVKGREPHALGVLNDAAQGGSDSGSPQLSPIPPVPPQASGYSGVLIQPE